jgi:predicted kinase
MRADGSIVCEHFGQIILKSFNPNERNNKGAIVFHHKIPLTLLNVNEASISINPENIAILHWRCHNEVHQRFGFGSSNIIEKKIYLVTGASCSGKTSWVRERAEANDLLLDIDDIWQMVSGLPRYQKPNSLKPIVFRIRDEMKTLISKGAGTWRNAYVIESLPSPMDRKREADRYKAFNVEVVTMDATEAECLERLHRDPQGRDAKAYEGYIREYFSRFQE